MKVYARSIESTFQIVSDEGFYLGSIVKEQHDLLGELFVGDLIDFSKDRVYCTFQNHSVENVIRAMAQYFGINVVEKEIEFV